MISDAHRRLRDATQADHRRLEDRLDILSRLESDAGRRALTGRFWRLHAEMEAATAPWIGDLAGLEFDQRRRTSLLRGDLDAMGLAAPPAAAGAIAAHSIGEALGLMYVLEGSTLGGRAIRREVEARGGDMAGLGFLDPYGARTGERWRSFLAVLDDVLETPAACDAAVAGALAGFRHAELRLCEAPAHV